MHKHSLEILDFFRIRNRVIELCRSHEGVRYLENSLPCSKPSDVLAEQHVVRDIVAKFQSGSRLTSTECPDITDIFPKLSKEGSVLDLDELLALGLWSRSYEAIKNFLSDIENEILEKLILTAPDLSLVTKTVFHIVKEDGSIRELPELKPFISRIRRLEQEIQKTTASLCSDSSVGEILQNTLPTQRDGRTVLAVKIAYKSRMHGIVHEISDTGQTAFIEPEILVQKNNELIEAEAEYQRELLAILRRTTRILQEQNSSLEEANPAMARLDALQAKAHYSLVTKGVFVEYGENRFELFHARHPLLGTNAVPITLALPESKRELIITGPNTGGKTVTLKTAGLLALMFQFGLALPAAEGSRLPVFDEVLVDLGDEQSIDASLSTFSAHMKTIGEIASNATDNSLVLLDELGSGTDPEEGGALAMALLDFFREHRCTVIVTSHLSVLKNYAYNHEETMNASVEFDKVTLGPTYKLLLGFPGESHALTIAERYGVPRAIIENARDYCKADQADASKMLRELHEKYQELESAEYAFRKREQAQTEQRRQLDLDMLKLRQRLHELKTRESSELKTFVAESRRTLENLVRMIQEGTITKEKTLAAKKFINELESKSEEAESELASEAEQLDLPEESSTVDLELCEGMHVRILPAKRDGVLIRKVKNGAWLVATDSLKLTIPAERIQPVQPKAYVPSTMVEASPAGGTRALLELDVRGCRMAEALVLVEQQLNAAMLAHLGSFSIIHGTGEGILQKGIHDFLRQQTYIADYHFARPEEGGAGKTVVQFRQ